MRQDGNGAQKVGRTPTLCNQKSEKHSQSGRAALCGCPSSSSTVAIRTGAGQQHSSHLGSRHGCGGTPGCVGRSYTASARTCHVMHASTHRMLGTAPVAQRLVPPGAGQPARSQPADVSKTIALRSRYQRDLHKNSARSGIDSGDWRNV